MKRPRPDACVDGFASHRLQILGPGEHAVESWPGAVLVCQRCPFVQTQREGTLSNLLVGGVVVLTVERLRVETTLVDGGGVPLGDRRPLEVDEVVLSHELQPPRVLYDAALERLDDAVELDGFLARGELAELSEPELEETAALIGRLSGEAFRIRDLSAPHRLDCPPTPRSAS